MAKTYIVSDNIITSLGFTTSENFKNLEAGITGVKPTENSSLYPDRFPASIVDRNKLDDLTSSVKLNEKFTFFEKLIILSIQDALDKTKVDPSKEDTCIILSTTKGNIELLKKSNNHFKEDRVHLWKSAELIGQYFSTKSIPLVISNACISGVMDDTGLVPRIIQ